MHEPTTFPDSAAFPSEQLPGLTKREYFAAQAAAGLAQIKDLADKEIANHAVAVADFLIDALNAQEGETHARLSNPN